MGWTTEESWFSSQQGQEIFVFIFSEAFASSKSVYKKQSGNIVQHDLIPCPQTYTRTHNLEFPSSASYLPNLGLRYFDLFELLEFMTSEIGVNSATSVEALEKSLMYKICGIWRVIQRNRGTKTTATDLQIQNTEKLLQQIYKYKVLLCAEII